MRAHPTIELATAGLLLTSCTSSAVGGVYEGPWLEEEALTIEFPQLYVPPAEANRPGPPPRLSAEPMTPRMHPLGDSVGWAQWQTRESAFQLNALTLNPLRRLTPLIELAREESGRHVDDGLEWGPYPDPRGQPLEWVVAEAGDTVQLRVRAEGSQESFEPFWTQRGTAPSLDGSVDIHTGLIAELPALGSHVHDEVRAYAGSIHIEVGSDPINGGRWLQVEWQDFSATADPLADIDFLPTGSTTFTRGLDGSGAFVLALREPWDDDIGFTGPATDLGMLELVWEADESGFARLFIPPTGADNPEGDPNFGPLELQECFDGYGELMWRDITDAYLQAQPDYEKGEPTDCSGDSPWPAVD